MLTLKISNHSFYTGLKLLGIHNLAVLKILNLLNRNIILYKFPSKLGLNIPNIS